MIAKTSWLAACISTSTMTLAAASVPRTPRSARQRAPMKSPPIWASGNSALAPSRTKRKPDAEPDRGPLLAREQQPPAAARNRHRGDAGDHHQRRGPAGADHGVHRHGRRHTTRSARSARTCRRTRRSAWPAYPTASCSLKTSERTIDQPNVSRMRQSSASPACRYLASSGRLVLERLDRSTAGIRAIRAARFAAAGRYRV